MKKILYIYGYGSNENSNTKNNLQDVLGKEHYCVESVCYNQLQPDEAIEYLSNYVENNNVDAVIGSSLGAFYALHLQECKIPVVVINPCMKPTEILPKLGCPSEIVKRFEKYERYDKINLNVYSLFGLRDEVLNYSELFESLFGKMNFSYFNSKHRPTKEELASVKDVIEAHL